VKVAIHQPHYLPWLGYFAKWAAADVFVLLDTVQYEKNGWQNRNRIKTRDGARWLTVPVHAKFGMAIADVTIDTSQPWPARHLAAISHAYATAPGFAKYRDALAEFYELEWAYLAPLAVASASWLSRALGITTPVRLASELGVTASDPTARLVDLTRAVGGTTYLAGRDGATYLEPRRFADAGIAVLQQRYEHPVYAQLHGEFVPFLSALDLLLTHGDAALSTLRRGDGWCPLEPR
jgi:WbqC-like protein family